MPLKKGKSFKTISKNIAELHTGKTYAHTAEKFGKEKANKQAVAIAYSVAGKSKNKKVKKNSLMAHAAKMKKSNSPTKDAY